MSEVSMERTIQQWVSIQRKKAEERSAKVIAKKIIDRAMETLQMQMDEGEKTSEEIVFLIMDAGEISTFGIPVSMSDIRIPDAKIAKEVCERMEDTFKNIPNLNVEKKDKCYNGSERYTRIIISVSKDGIEE